MSQPLSIDEIQARLLNLPGWTLTGDKISKEFVLDNFRDAISFIMRLSFEAEALEHHPELENVYNRVKVSLTTHDAGNRVTENDLSLATAIESLSRI